VGVAINQLQLDADESVTRATLQRFARPKSYERLADLASVTFGMLVLWPFLLVLGLGQFDPRFGSLIFAFPLMLLGCFTVRPITLLSSDVRRSVVRWGVKRSFVRDGKAQAGDFVGIAYSERILDLPRGVDWDYGFLELTSEGLLFEGVRSHFLLSHDCVDETELKQYRLSREGWFVRLFVHWMGQDGSKECFSVCFQEKGMLERTRHPLTEQWKRKIEDWRWNYMGTPVPHKPEFPISSSSVDNTMSRKSNLMPPYPRVVAGLALASTLALGGAIIAAMFLTSCDWLGSLAVAAVLCGPRLFLWLFSWLFRRA
jgi:hypothetical protein